MKDFHAIRFEWHSHPVVANICLIDGALDGEVNTQSTVLFLLDEEGLLVEVHSVVGFDERLHVPIFQIYKAQSVRSCDEE